jgi:predicted RNA binding protein YcfA (HicA-like mRNA interferase family)
VGLDYQQLRNLAPREIVSALVRDGFTFDRGSGSHQIYYHPDGRRVTVVFHGGSRTFTRKTLKSIIESQARWTEDDLKRLKLVH